MFFLRLRSMLASGRGMDIIYVYAGRLGSLIGFPGEEDGDA